MGAVTTPRTVSEARYAFWRTIVDLAKESGIPKAEWCRSNCISLKTFNHYEGIFERQARRTSYYKGSRSQSWMGRGEASVVETDGESTTATDDCQGRAGDQEVSAVESVQDATGNNPLEQTKRIGTDPERYFEIPLSGERYFIGEDSTGTRKVERYEETENDSGAEAENEAGADSEANVGVGTKSDSVADTEATTGNGSANAEFEVMSHSSRAETAEGITIEADGFKLTIGANVSVESLGNILKAVKGNA